MEKYYVLGTLPYTGSEPDDKIENLNWSGWWQHSTRQNLGQSVCSLYMCRRTQQLSTPNTEETPLTFVCKVMSDRQACLSQELQGNLRTLVHVCTLMHVCSHTHVCTHMHTRILPTESACN